MSIYESTPRSDLPELPLFSQLSDRVWRVMGLNPGKFTLQGTNTYIVGAGKRKVLIDCGDGQPGYVPLLIQSLHSIDPDAYLSDILISHCHNDHWGGLPDILASSLNQQPHPIRLHKYPLPKTARLYPFFHNQLHKLPSDTTFCDLSDNQLLVIDETTHLRVIHTPGHAKDHCAFYLEQQNTVFTADCILGHGSVAFEDLTEYLHGLEKIKALQPVCLFPGHGQEEAHHAMDKINQYIALRVAKEKQILDIFLNDTNVHWSSFALATVMSANKKYHEHLLYVVVRTVGLHLIKLYLDGKIQLVNADSIMIKNPYDTRNVMDIAHETWKYVGGDQESKL